MYVERVDSWFHPISTCLLNPKLVKLFYSSFISNFLIYIILHVDIFLILFLRCIIYEFLLTS